jgi:hypothetical protein
MVFRFRFEGSIAPGCRATAGTIRIRHAILSLVGVPVLFVLPGLACLECVVAFEIREALDSFPLLPGKPEIDVLKLIVETDFARVFEAGPEIHTIDSRNRWRSCTSDRVRRSHRDRNP